MALKIALIRKPSLQNIPLIFFVFEGDDITKHSLFQFLNSEEQEYIRKTRKNLELKEKEVRVLFMPGTGRKVFVVAVSSKENFSTAKAGLATRIAVQTAKKEKIKKFAFWVSPVGSAKETQNFYEVVAANALMANFEFIKYKTPTPGGHNFIDEIQAVLAKPDKNIEEGLRRGVIIGEEVNSCRLLANTPGGDLTPNDLAEEARRAAKGQNIKVAVLDEKKIKKLKMGGVLGVGRGSDAPPRFIIMEYMRASKREKPIVLVGKGVTFDTGGLNLKPDQSIYEMHMDMSGGAAVIHAIRAASRLKLKKNIVGLIPAVENMPSGSSYH
ncbi:MAG: M17 family peptidase N-terminal domain-containing protein, partial [bacterium]|nr:M17 family peptidase N-terminal domain-containing protein [bacterium]